MTQKITLFAIVKTRDMATIPYEVDVAAWATIADLESHIRLGLKDQHGLEGDYELNGVRLFMGKVAA